MHCTRIEGEKMVIKKLNVVDYSLLLLMYLQLVILEFFGYGQTLNKVIAILILARVLFMSGKQWKYGLLCGSGLGTLYILSLLFGDSFVFSNAQSNFLMLLYPFIYTYYIVFMCKNRPYIIDKLLENCFWVFNITMIVNIIVLLMQIFVPYSVNAVIADSNEIGFYEDTISGLFRYASTHVVCLFTIFIILYDISYIKRIQKKGIRIIIWILVAVMSLISFFIAANSDNKAFFLLLPLLIFAFWFSDKMSVTSRFLKVVSFFLIVPIIIMLLYSFNNDIRTFIDDYFLKTFNLIMNAHSLGASANGSNERIAILPFSLSRVSTWITGTGFGSSYIYSSGYLGFNHFGQADLGSILILGGIWFAVFLMVYYIKGFVIIIGRQSRMNSRVLKFSLFVILFCTAVYTQCFTRTNTMSVLILIMLAFRVREYSDGKNMVAKDK